MKILVKNIPGIAIILLLLSYSFINKRSTSGNAIGSDIQFITNNVGLSETG